MKVVILAGGKGTRISEESRRRPKPMVEIGGEADFMAYHEAVCFLWLSGIYHMLRL